AEQVAVRASFGSGVTTLNGAGVVNGTSTVASCASAIPAIKRHIRAIVAARFISAPKFTIHITHTSVARFGGLINSEAVNKPNGEYKLNDCECAIHNSIHLFL